MNQQFCAHQGPTLPLNPAPKQPPSHFLSSRAVICNSVAINQQPNSNSCSALLELDSEQQHRITAVTLQQRRHKNKELKQFGTTGRATRTRDKAKNGRSSSVTAASSRQQSILNSVHQRNEKQQESPQTDISYIQSDGSSTNKRQNARSSTYLDEAPEYDPVMTESIHQIVQENARKKNG